MDRRVWIKEKRRLCEERMDTLFAPDYDEHWGRIDALHRDMMDHFLASCPPHGRILDAACGTGKYWPQVLGSGRAVFGVDQSGGMLRAANEKFPTVPTEKTGLQELAYEDEFDGVMCVDAMENVFPEDWPVVLQNLRRALKRNGTLYLTVELAPPEEVREAYRIGRRLGLPVVAGEHAHEGGYHYYPPAGAIREWVASASLRVTLEDEDEDYFHILAHAT